MHKITNIEMTSPTPGIETNFMLQLSFMPCKYKASDLHTFEAKALFGIWNL